MNRTASLLLICVLVTVAGCKSDTSSPAQPTAPSTPVVVPVVLNAPTPVTPLAGSTQTVSSWPTFTVTNSTRTGPAGAITYRFEVSTSSAFTPLVINQTVVEGTGQTSFTPLPSQMPIAQSGLFWRATALDAASGTNTASAVQNITLKFTDQSLIAAAQGVVMFSGTQPPAGTFGHAVLGDGWDVRMVSSFQGELFLSPKLHTLQVIDLIDRGLSPGDAIIWLDGHGYPTDAQFYPGIVGGVVGFPEAYISLESNGRWNLTTRSGA